MEFKPGDIVYHIQLKKEMVLVRKCIRMGIVSWTTNNTAHPSFAFQYNLRLISRPTLKGFSDGI